MRMNQLVVFRLGDLSFFLSSVALIILFVGCLEAAGNCLFLSFFFSSSVFSCDFFSFSSLSFNRILCVFLVFILLLLRRHTYICLYFLISLGLSVFVSLLFTSSSRVSVDLSSYVFKVTSLVFLFSCSLQTSMVLHRTEEKRYDCSYRSSGDGGLECCHAWSQKVDLASLDIFFSSLLLLSLLSPLLLPFYRSVLRYRHLSPRTCRSVVAGRKFSLLLVSLSFYRTFLEPFSPNTTRILLRSAPCVHRGVGRYLARRLVRVL